MRISTKTASLLATVGIGVLAGTHAWSAETLQDVMKRRGLNEMDVLAAAKTYTPSGKRDEFIVFSSGGQSGQVIVYGIPSMRILKYIGVFTPEPWQGYGYDDESKKVLNEGASVDGRDVLFGDTHHPAISETNGDYDGQYLFINDKNTPRIAVIDLKDFETKQIVKNPVIATDHGGAFVSPNTDYIIEASQYPAPLGGKFAPLDQFNEKYRGAITYWHFNREKGRIEPKNSFAIEMPPYSQDLSDFGKLASDGWSFTNSFCAERYVGGIEKGRPPFEAGCSAKDTDFLHVVNWRKAEELFKAGKTKMVNGMAVIPLDVAAKEGVLYFIPEPKSPHGVDVTPDGKFITVAGKLDTHVSVFSFEKIQAAIKAGKFTRDDYGVPIIDMKEALHTQVELGLGPLHTQYDSKPCIAYTSLYVDSMVAKWDYCEGKVLDKISVQYNIGHLMAMEGDTEHPKGHYLVALNKLAIDRFNPVGPLHPQNHQLIDIGGDKMQLLYDMPLPLGEPHYAVAISADKLKPIVRYPFGTNSREDAKSASAVRPGSEHVDRTPGKVEVFGTAIRSHFNPEIVEVTEGDEVTFHMTNLERAEDETHGFAVSKHNVNLSLEPGKTSSVTFKANKAGVYPYYCTEFCSALHLEMEGYLIVQPANYKAASGKMESGQTYTKADYETRVKTNEDTQKVIDSVVGYITSVNYKDFPTVVNLVEDATDQLNSAAQAKQKSEDFAKKQDWNNAMLWAEQWFQYQVKAADIGLRAKTYLEQNGAKKVN
ncbi:MAG: Sec-dependent nitrous-oxide reductase [Magnetospirillum sp.]|nr:Sec-dependent nitrous-oxide reductase [Magnetospirillum sp.]